MYAEQTSDLAGRINRIEQNLFMPSRISEYSAQKSSLLDAMERYGVPGVSVAVIHQGNIEWAKGYGVQDVETQVPVTIDTLFQAASISKPVTAAAVLRLVDAGQLDLDEDVNTTLRTWKITGTQLWQPRVTLRHLLCHGAGVTVHGFHGYAHDAVLPTLEQVLAGQRPANTDPIRVDTLPGAQFRYSGGGFCILQRLLMDVTGLPFPELMRDLVLDPVGMKQSTFHQPLPRALMERAATGHRNGAKPVAGKWHTYAEMAAAGLWTTPSDLARFVLALQRSWSGETGSLLSQAITRQMLTPQVVRFFGLSFWLTPQGVDYGTTMRFTHPGGNEGFSCLLEAYCQEGLGAVAMTNVDQGMGKVEGLIPAIAQEYNWPGFLPKAAGVPEQNSAFSDAYIGVYELRQGFTFTILKQAGSLFLKPTGQHELALFPESETAYRLNGIDATVTFVKEGLQQEVTSLLFKQNDVEIAAKKQVSYLHAH